MHDKNYVGRLTDFEKGTDMGIEFEQDSYRQAQEADILTRVRDESRRKCIESSARELQREGSEDELMSEEAYMRANALRGTTKE